ncbi:MAG TPA: FG-GAP-like repeat-containing protein, partial [Pyrinomonadaceae bacterium]
MVERIGRLTSMFGFIQNRIRFFVAPLALIALAGLLAAPAYAVGECSPPSFNVAESFNTNSNPSANVIGGANVAVGDFNSDGASDLVVANYNADTFSLLLGEGDGSFAPPQSFPVGVKVFDGLSHPLNVAVSDFNGDSKLDVVVVGGITTSNGWVSVLLGDGAGGFGPANNMTTGAPTIAPAVGDFNGDGKKDIAVTTANSNSVSILLGNGAGGFNLAGNIKTPAQTTLPITVADFNGDGMDDIAAAGFVSGATWSFTVILGNSAGTFTVHRSLPVHWSPLSIAAGDFNNDGKVDLAVTITFSSPAHGVAVMLGDGTGNFSPANEIFIGYEPMSVVTSDFNKDGRTDMAVIASSSNSVAVLLGDGAGLFSSIEYFGTNVSPGSLAVGDFNNDGAPDLVARSPRSDIVSILLGDGDGSFATSRTELTGGAKVETADFNGDGIADLAIMNNATFTQAAIQIRYGDGNGGLKPPVNYPVAQGPKTIAVADFNSDGRLDIAIGYGLSVSILFGNSVGGFNSTPVTYPAPNSVGGIIAGDFNGDARADLVYGTFNNSALVGLLVNDGSGGFKSPPTYYGSGEIPTAIRTGDFNRDSKLDLALSNFSGTVTILLGNGAGSLTPAPYLSVTAAAKITDLTVADLNKDGWDDLIMPAPEANSVTLLFNNGAGFATPVTLEAKGGPQVVKVADFNMDGNPDMAVGAGGDILTTGNILIFTGDGTGAFSAPAYFVAGGGTADIVAADFNRDGKPDLAATGGVISSTNTTLLLNTFKIQPCLSVASQNVTEGDSGANEAVFTINLSSASAQVVKVNYVTKSHTATSGVDYQHSSGRLVFSPGVTTRTVRVPINGDTLDEVDEDFYLLLSNPANAAIGSGQGIATIIDNDPEPAISISDVSVQENSFNGNAAFDVTLSAPSSKLITFAYSTADGTATTSGADYSNSATTRQIPIGETKVRIFIAIRNDAIFEPDETFFVNLSSPVNATIARAQAQATIINDDPLPSISISSSGFVNEGDSGTREVLFSVRLSNPSYQPVSVSYATADATATAGSDYAAASGILTFSPEETIKSISVQVNGDTQAEADELFSVNLSTAVNATLGTTQAQMLIVDDDSPRLQFTQSSYNVSEGVGVLTLTVTRSGDKTAPISVKYSTSDLTDANFRCDPTTTGQPTGFASRKCDYHIAVGKLRFAAGEDTKQLVLSFVDDAYLEGSEFFNLRLSNPVGATLGQNNNVRVTISDNDLTASANPIDDTRFFVRQLYVDLLSREPDPAGWQGWTTRIDQCGQPGQPPPPCDRVTVAGDGFLRSGEFFDRQFFVIRLYRTGLGRILRYDEVGDLAFVSGFLTAEQLELNKQDLVNEIITRGEFASRYNLLNNGQYVDTLLQTAGVAAEIPASVRQGWITALDTSARTRAQVYREI